MILQTLLYKNNKIYIFFQNNLRITKKCNTFAPDLEIVLIATLKIKHYEKIVSNCILLS